MKRVLFFFLLLSASSVSSQALAERCFALATKENDVLFSHTKSIFKFDSVWLYANRHNSTPYCTKASGLFGAFVVYKPIRLDGLPTHLPDDRNYVVWNKDGDTDAVYMDNKLGCWDKVMKKSTHNWVLKRDFSRGLGELFIFEKNNSSLVCGLACNPDQHRPRCVDGGKQLVCTPDKGLVTYSCDSSSPCQDGQVCKPSKYGRWDDGEDFVDNTLHTNPAIIEPPSNWPNLPVGIPLQ